MANDGSIGTGNSKIILDSVTRLVKELGMPTALLIAFLWIGVHYWIGPQTSLMKQLGENNAKQSEFFQTMTENNTVIKDEMKDMNVNLEEFTKQATDCHTEQLKLLQKIWDNG